MRDSLCFDGNGASRIAGGRGSPRIGVTFTLFAEHAGECPLFRRKGKNSVMTYKTVDSRFIYWFWPVYVEVEVALSFFAVQI